MNEVGAKKIDKSQQKRSEKVDIEIHIGVFFDGTNNNANNNKLVDWFNLDYFTEKKHALNNSIIPNPEKKLSNPAILSSLFMTDSNNNYKNRKKEGNNTEEGLEKYLHVYIEGSGANGFQAQNQIVDFAQNGKAVVGLGFGLGSTGVVAKVSKAIKYISERIDLEESNNNTNITNIHFYIFGFSRGSTCARLLSYLIARSKEGKELPREKEFDKYLWKKNFKNGRVRFLDEYEKTVDFLGIYDTVSAIGFLKDADIIEGDKVIKEGDVNNLRTLFMYNPDFWGNFHRENSKNYGLFSPTLDKVLSTCHICALDEFRSNFALTDIGDLSNKNNIELFIPGCHSDVGGGYISTSKAEKKTLLIFKNGKTRLCIDNPTNKNVIFKELSVEILKELGWIDDNRTEITNNSEKEIEFSHCPRPEKQYSNVPLLFMYKRAIKQAEKLRCLFNCSPEDLYAIPDDLKVMSETLDEYIYKNGRFYYYLGGSYNSSKYKQIRQKYLHFTSTDTLHSFGDPGNPPGRQKEDNFSNICRLVYRGNDIDTNVHYMHNYDNGTLIQEKKV